MKKYEIYLDGKEKILISEFKNIDDEYEKRIISGRDIYEYIEMFSEQNIVAVYEPMHGNDIHLEYKNYIVVLNEYDKLSKVYRMQYILNNMKKFYEKEKLQKSKKKKVKRENKYTGRRIYAGIGCLLILGNCALGLSKRESSTVITTEETIHTTDLEFEDNSYKVPQYDAQNNTIIIPQQQIEEQKEEVKMVSIDYEDRSTTTKANNAKQNYYALIEKYSKMYGLDSRLVLGIATQERGIHSSKTDPGGATGLMQIQNDVWVDHEVTAYNFELGKNETIKVDSNNIKRLETNIKIGCMILQNCFRYMKYNPLASVQCYNMGYGNMKKILNSYSSDSDKTVDEILSDVYDIGWMDYRDLIKVGDQNYVENVFSWIGSNIELHIVNKGGELIDLKINNELNNKKVY